MIVGDVTMTGLAATRAAKSVVDAGWSMLREELCPKAMRHGEALEVVGGNAPPRRVARAADAAAPKGIAGVRMSACSGCGTLHAGEINAARNPLLLPGRNLAMTVAACK